MKKLILLFTYFLIATGCIDEITSDPGILSDSTNNEAVISTKSDDDSVCYYWYNNEKVYLPVADDTYFAIFPASVLNGMTVISSLSNIEFEDYQYIISSYDGNNDETQYMWAKINAEIAHAYADEIVYIAPYLIGTSTELGITDRFYIKLKSENDYDLLTDFASDNGAEIVNENFLPLWYALVCTDSSTENALSLSNAAYESGLFDKTDIYLMGNFSWDNEEQPYNDTYYSSQWNLHGEYGIDIETVHAITYGSTLGTVAVIDSGVWLEHPDLRIYTSWDAVSQTSPAKVHYNQIGVPHKHGTEMTGIIGAIPDNHEGIAGIDPGLGLIPISIGEDPLEHAEMAIRYAADHGAKVISNSYSFASPQERIDDAFRYAIDKGCVMVQSAGNINYNIPKYPYAAISEVISVGAITPEGRRWEVSGTSDGSTFGDHLDVVAPGVNITTTTIPYFDNDYANYKQNCTGTSPACPHVAATAGLILSLNRRLTSQQVKDIIECTARKLPQYDFAMYQAKPNGPWNNEVGYGLINPVDALRLAQGYYKLIEFDYSDTYIELRLTANKDIAIIWDWDTNDITEFSVSSADTCTFTHTYGMAGTRRICIAEKIDFQADEFSYYSNALVKFDLLTGEKISDLDIKPNNRSLEYVRIQGGSEIEDQTISIKNLLSLTDLYLVQMKDVDVELNNCPSLLRFGSSRYIYKTPEIADTDVPGIEIMDGTVGLDFVSGKFPQLPPTPMFILPSVPESTESFGSLNITYCNSLTEMCLENVNITHFDFSNLSKLEYLYISSHDDRIVGGYDNIKGDWLKNSIATLQQRPSNEKGKVVIRAVNSTNTQYINAIISQSNLNLIETTYGSDKNWDVVWDPGVTVHQ